MPSDRLKEDRFTSFIAISVIVWIVVTVWMLVTKGMLYYESRDPREAFELWVMASVAMIAFISFANYSEKR